MATLLFGASFISLLDNSYINRRQTTTDDPIIDSLEMPDCNYVPLPKEMQSDLKSATEIIAHPIFTVTDGEIEDWESVNYDIVYAHDKK